MRVYKTRGISLRRIAQNTKKLAAGYRRVEAPCKGPKKPEFRQRKRQYLVRGKERERRIADSTAGKVDTVNVPHFVAAQEEFFRQPWFYKVIGAAAKKSLSHILYWAVGQGRRILSAAGNPRG